MFDLGLQVDAQHPRMQVIHPTSRWAAHVSRPSCLDHGKYAGQKGQGGHVRNPLNNNRPGHEHSSRCCYLSRLNNDQVALSLSFSADPGTTEAPHCSILPLQVFLQLTFAVTFTAGHVRADSGHLPLGGGLLPNRSMPETSAGPSSGLNRTESDAPLLLTPPALQSTLSPNSQVWRWLASQSLTESRSGAVF